MNAPSKRQDTGSGWTSSMAKSYVRGKQDGNGAVPPATATLVAASVDHAACYWQGYSHGVGRCCCPPSLAPKHGRCSNCGSYQR